MMQDSNYIDADGCEDAEEGAVTTEGLFFWLAFQAAV